MKTFSKLTFIILSSLIYLVFTGCSSEEIPGPQGEEGPEGPQGEKGEPGSVDIYYSEWIDSGFPNIPYINAAFNIIDDNINTDLVNAGIFLAYGKSGVNTIIPIPISVGILSYYYYIFPEVQIVKFVASTSNNTSAIFNNFNQYRFVIIPLEEMPTNRAVKLENLSYEEVCELYNIPK